MHENLLHICQDIRSNGNDEEESNNDVPHDIHVKRMLVSKVTPKIGLSKYLALTMDKHARDADSYEKEACLIVLQILKGLEHLAQHGLMVESIDTGLVLLSDIQRGVLSPNYSNNNSEVLGCPIAMYLALPGSVKSQAKDQSSSESPESRSKVESESVELSNTESSKDMQAKKTAENNDVKEARLTAEQSKELIALIFDVFHASHLLDDGLEEDNKSILEVPKLPVKSMYSELLQVVIERLFHNASTSITRLIKEFQIIAFCPMLMQEHSLSELNLVWNKWRTRRCVDMVTDILKKYSLISLASGLASGGTNNMGLARNCVLECQFLSNVTAEEIAEIVSETAK